MFVLSAFLDLSVTAFSLIDTTSGEPVNKITIDKQAKFSLGVRVKVGKTDGIVPFTAGDSPNYEYHFYISRDADTIQYEIGEAKDWRGGAGPEVGHQ